MSAPKITVYFLQASRSIRTVWLLEELGLPYEIEFADRVAQKAPQEFKDRSGNPLGKFPVLVDGDLTVVESGNITEYLCETYDPSHRLLPTSAYLRNKVRTWIHASEATFALHGLAILYTRWSFPSPLATSHPEALAEMEAKIGVNVQKDLDWLETELSASTGMFLVGNSVTAADVMMLFSVQFIFERGLGTGMGMGMETGTGTEKVMEGRRWRRVEEWRERCERTEGYRRAVERSGHTLYPEST